MNINIKEIFLIFLRGLFMGSADIIPGVSGGTIALITGIYERLINGISKISFKFIKPLLKGNFKEFKNELIEEVDFELFVPLILGIGVAFLSLASVITFLMDNYPAFIFSFFLGLILASATILYKQIDKIKTSIIIVTLLGFIFAYLLGGAYNSSFLSNHSLVVVFFSGLIAICAMILPGISGSFILLLLGQYEFMLNALKSFNIPEIITFIVGALIGILGFSRILSFLLDKYEQLTMAFLIGIMVGSLRIPYMQMTTTNFGGSILSCLILVVIGFILIMFLETKFNYID